MSKVLMFLALGAAALSWWLFDQPYAFEIAFVFLVVAFAAGCFAFDYKGRGGSRSAAVVVLRVLARHVKLACKIAFGVFVIYGAAMAALAWAAETSRGTRGSTSEGGFAHLADSVTAPLQWLVEGFAVLLGALAMVICIVCAGVSPNPPPIWHMNGSGELLSAASEGTTWHTAGSVIYDGSHYQMVLHGKKDCLTPELCSDAELVANGTNCWDLGADRKFWPCFSQPDFNHSGGLTQDGDLVWQDLGTPKEAQGNFHPDARCSDSDIAAGEAYCALPSISFWDIGLFGEYQLHPLPFNLFLFALYLLWLFATVWQIAKAEFPPRGATLLAIRQKQAEEDWDTLVSIARSGRPDDWRWRPWYRDMLVEIADKLWPAIIAKDPEAAHCRGLLAQIVRIPVDKWDGEQDEHARAVLDNAVHSGFDQILWALLKAQGPKAGKSASELAAAAKEMKLDYLQVFDAEEYKPYERPVRASYQGEMA